MVARNNRVVGATVQKQPGVDAERHVVVGYRDVVAPLRRDDAVIAWQHQTLHTPHYYGNPEVLQPTVLVVLRCTYH